LEFRVLTVIPELLLLNAVTALSNVRSLFTIMRTINGYIPASWQFTGVYRSPNVPSGKGMTVAIEQLSTISSKEHLTQQ